MGHGGKRDGAGSKPGQKKVVKDGSLVFLAPRLRELANEFLASDSEQVRLTAFKSLLPYVFQEQPKQLQHGGLGGEPIQVTFIEVGSNGKH